MEVNARISKEWRRRMLFLFFMIFGIAAWFLSDGYIYWPKEADRYVEYSEIKERLIASGEAEDDDSPSLRLAWQRHAKEADYSSKVPKERTAGAIREQRVIGWVLTIGSLAFALWIAWNHKLSIRAEGEIVIGASGQRVELDAFTSTDRKKWDDKGIAFAIYESGGKPKRLCIDDHKFKGSEAILLEIERRIKARTEQNDQSEEDEVAPA